MNNSMDNSIKNFRDNFRGQFQDSFRYNFKANARDNFRTIFQNLSVIVQLMELKDFSVLFSLEYCATELTGVILHGSTPTFRTFVMAKKGISLYWARLKLRENTPFVVELLASGASKWVEIISKGKRFILCTYQKCQST